MAFVKDHPFGDIGDLMTVEDWLEACEETCFLDCDGFGDAVRWVGTDEIVLEEFIYPSQRDQLPEGTTHILWFNK